MIRRAVLVVLCAAGASAACSSTERVRTAPTVSTASTTAGSSSAGPTTSSPPLEATVPDCGAGAYRPSTLLIVCSTGGTMATDIRWTAWGTAAASGTGTVHLSVGGSQQTGLAKLELSDVSERGNSGPQFSRLTVTWIGPSPDGHPTDSFPLGNG